MTSLPLLQSSTPITNQEEFIVPRSSKNVGLLSTSDLLRECRAEFSRYIHHQRDDDFFQLELFRRAIVLRDDYAWSCIYDVYHNVAWSWLLRSQISQSLSQEDVAEIVNMAFARFALALTPAKWHQCRSVASLLDYLKHCVHSVILNELELRQRRERIARENPERFTVNISMSPRYEDPATLVLSAISLQEFWQAIQDELLTEQERLLFSLLVVEEMKPSKICQVHSHFFPTVNEVYRIRRNMLERLRRRLRRFAPCEW